MPDWRRHKTLCPMKGKNGMAAREVDVLVVGAGPAGLSPTAPLCAPQHHTEAVLLAHARSFGVEVVFGQEVLRVDVGDERAEALIREGDRTRAVSARYVIGADGARSIV